MLWSAWYLLLESSERAITFVFHSRHRVGAVYLEAWKADVFASLLSYHTMPISITCCIIRLISWPHGAACIHVFFGRYSMPSEFLAHEVSNHLVMSPAVLTALMDINAKRHTRQSLVQSKLRNYFAVPRHDGERGRTTPYYLSTTAGEAWYSTIIVR